jgi:hypothetical protein
MFFSQMKRLLTFTLFLGIAWGQDMTWLNGSYTAMEIGAPEGILGMGVYHPEKNYYLKLSGKLSNHSLDDDDAYDFSPNLFYQDEDRGKAHGFVGFGGGYIYSFNPKIQIFAGALFGFKDTWYKRYDSSQILGDDGVYYIQDDDGTSLVISPGFGLLFPNEKGNQFIVGFDANPMNIYLGYSWKNE